ncbi:hypothetical protein Trisim1_002507 [Trichoderma cf. simile WF8]
MSLQELPIEMEIDEEVSVYEDRSLQQTDSATNQFMNGTALDIDLNLLASIIRQDALPLFETHCQEIHHFWSWLTRKTFIPGNVAIGDSIITSAFAIVDDAILHSGDCVWRSRLAYVQLTRILISLKSIIARRGRLRRGVGQGNASILIDLYVKAQTEPFSPKALRQKVQNRVRIAKRWADLISGSIFIAAAYNDKAEMMIRDFSVTNARIKEVANHALRACTLFLPKRSMLSNDYIFEQDMAVIRPA